MRGSNVLLEYERQRHSAVHFISHFETISFERYSDPERGKQAKLYLSGFYMTVIDHDLSLYEVDPMVSRAVVDGLESFPADYVMTHDVSPIPEGFLLLYFGIPYQADQHTETLRWLSWAWGTPSSMRQRLKHGDRINPDDAVGMLITIGTECSLEREWDRWGEAKAIPRNFLIWEWNKPADAVSGLDDVPGAKEAAKVLASLWAFMQQRIAPAVRQKPTRQVARRIQRATGMEPPEVSVVRLRAVEQAVYERAESEGVEWSRRWIVRGHWRNQWYASEGVHKLIWIAPYVKGPEGAPLIGSRKVFDVSR